MTAETVDLILRTLREDEGLKLRPYRCTMNKWTIGYGHNLDGKPIRKEAAELILQHDIEDAVEDLRRLVPNLDDLSPNRQVALVSMSFQLGGDTLKQFVNTLDHVRAGRFADAAKGMMRSRWAQQTPGRVKRLARMMEEG